MSRAPALRRALALALAPAALVAAMGLAPAAPAVAAGSPGPSAATSQDAFDTCDDPTSAQMAAWATSSDFTAAAMYMGGVNLACHQPNLTAGWVDAQLAAGWSLLPLYVGRQAPCTTQDWVRISATSATSQGQAAARDAVTILQRLGAPAGSIAYLDIEGYDPTPGCDDVVFRYLDGWTTQLHSLGFTAGVYGSALSPIAAIGDHYPVGTPGRPDAIWIARWNGQRDDAEPLLDPSQWAGRRIHQYRGDHIETHGGVRLNVASSFVHGDVIRRTTVDPAANPAHAPFPHWEGFVAQQQADLTGRTGPLQARTASVAALAAGTAHPDAFIELLLRGGWFEPHVAPIARLYWAYFGRIPDVAGATYWADRHRRGTQLATISQRFATSTEFERRLGRLSDEQFVRRIYVEVLGREADPAGVWFWTSRLGSKRATRGDVMVQFSESSEYRRRMAGQVDAFMVYDALLRRAPSPDALALAATLPIQQVIARVRASDEYAARVR